MIDLLVILLAPALRAVDGGSRNPLYWAAALAAWPLDILIAHTTWAFMAGFPPPGEWTVSHTLERLCHPRNFRDPRYNLYVALGDEINRISPTKNHIKILARGPR